jgi:AcrR family transcriptional regulator
MDATLRIVAKAMIPALLSRSRASGKAKRRGAAKERALAAATRILMREGYARLTMERVALDSGVAKTTLYRRWPTKAALCMELYLDVAGRELIDPDTGEIARDLKTIAEKVVRLQTQTVAGPAFIGLIAEAQINPETRPAFLAEFADRRRSITRAILRRAIERGQIHSDADIDLVIDALGGAITFRLLQGHAPISRDFTHSLVDLVLSGCRTRRTQERSMYD